MPLYEYRCEQGHRYDKREPFGSPASQPCEKCGKPAQRVPHAPAIAFKGSGWYSTDARGSRRSRGKEKSSAPSSASKPSNGASSTKEGAKKSGKADGKHEKAAAD